MALLQETPTEQLRVRRNLIGPASMTRRISKIDPIVEQRFFVQCYGGKEPIQPDDRVKHMVEGLNYASLPDTRLLLLPLPSTDVFR